MNIRIATDKEISRWDDLLVANPDGGNVFQALEMAETKRLGGWTPRCVLADDLAITVLEKSLPLLGKYWYIPKGPGLTDADKIAELVPDLKAFAASHSVFAIKIEPEIIESDAAHQQLTASGLVRSHNIQPNASTVVIDLAPSLDEVMAGLNQKGRHALKRAERDGVITKPVDLTDDNMRVMFDLLSSTAAGRFESSLRSYDYYQTFWQNYADNGHGQMFFAYVDGQVVAAAYCLLLGSKGLYKDGASIRERTVYGASHLLQWEAIKWMKDRGATSYDLCGAPHSSRINDETTPLYGVGRFKTSFNKHVTDYVGCYDIVVKPLAYKIWQRIGLRLALSLNYRFKHDQWY